jgi:hypothetical protein
LSYLPARWIILIRKLFQPDFFEKTNHACTVKF